MKFFSMIMMILVASFVAVSCGTDQGQGEPDGTGTLTLHLSTTSPLGIEYRLRDATVEIRGPEDRDVLTEDHLDDPVINEVMRSGTYTVTLLAGWRMEHRASGQPYSDIPAALASENPLVVTVVTDEVTPAIFQFEVDERLISFGPGTVALQVGVDETGAEWQGRTLVPSPASIPLHPRVAMDGAGNAIAIWAQPDPATPGVQSLFANRYTAASDSWGTTAELLETLDTYVEGYELAMNPQGTAMVIWSQDDPGSVTSIFARRYTAATGWEPVEVVENDDVNEARYPDITLDPQGNATAVWLQWEGTLANLSVNRFTPSGRWGNPELRESRNTYDASFGRVASNAQGHAVLVFSQRLGGIGQDEYMFVQRFTPATGWEDLAFSLRDYGVTAREIAMDPFGNVLVAGILVDETGTKRDAWAAHFNAGTEEWGPASFVTHLANSIRLAMDSEGNGAVVVSAVPSIFAKHFSPSSGWSNLLLIESLAADAGAPEIAMDGRGNAIAVWSQKDSLGTQWDVWTNRYTPARGWGAPEHLESGTGFQNLAEGIYPQVAMDPSGTAVAVWRNNYGLYVGWQLIANHFR